MTKNLADELHHTARQALTGLHPTPQGQEIGGLPFRRLIAAAFRARYLVFGTTLFGLLVGTFMAITTANSYQSTGKFLFTSSGAEKMQFDSTSATQTSQETIATGASYILDSDDLLMKVVNRLGAARILQPYQPGGQNDTGVKALFFGIQRDWNATKESDRTPEEALKRLQKTIFVERPRFTDVLIATCTANNAKLASEILATYMEEAIAWHIEKYDSKKAYETAKTAYEESQSRLDTARRVMRVFLERKALVAQFDVEMKRLQLEEVEASVRLNKLKDDVGLNQSVLVALNAALDGPDAIPKTVPGKVRLDMSKGAVSVLENRYADATLELTRLKGQLKLPDAKEIVAKERELKEIEDSIRRMQNAARAAQFEDVEIDNPVYSDKLGERTKRQSELITLRAQLEQAGALQTEKQTKLRRLLDLEPEYETLRNIQVTAEGHREAAQTNWNAAQQKRALGLGNFSSLNAIQVASLPLEKEGPNRSKLLLGGFFVGLFLGLGIVVLRVLPDTVVRTRDELEQIEGLAVIGVMPKLDGKNLRRHVSLREQGW